jgi:xylan 1,4-beta-xylosidase
LIIIRSLLEVVVVIKFKMKRSISRFCRVIFCLAAAGSVALPQSQSPPASYTNPVIAGDYPDPSVIRVGNDYWAVSTSSEWSPQFPLLHSTDLVNWEQVGAIFDYKPKWAVGNFWAPEIVARNGLYYIYYVGRKKGGPLSVAVAASYKPDGPYKDYGPLVSQSDGSIDPVVCKDEKGDPFLIWKEDGNSQRKPCIIWAQRLDDNGVTLIGEPKELIRNDASWEGAVVEGPFIIQRGDYFYMFYSGNGCCGLQCNYALGIARAKALLGPWEKNPRNPILTGNEDWRCPGHGSIVQDQQRRYFLLYHAYSAKTSVYTGREALLDEVTFNIDGWPEINLGMGPTSKGLSPEGKPQKQKELKYSDSFTAFKLKPGWNWPVADDFPASLSNGRLVLVAQPEQGTNLMGSVIGRSINTGNFLASTTVLRANLDAGVIAGLAALGDRANSTGIALVDDRVILWNRARGQQSVLAEAAAPKSRDIHFRLVAGQGKDYRFEFSADGKAWQELPETNGQHLPPWDRAVRVGLTVGGAPKAEARFDDFEMAPLEAGQ